LQSVASCVAVCCILCCSLLHLVLQSVASCVAVCCFLCCSLLHLVLQSVASCVAVCCILCCSLLHLVLQFVLADVYTNRESILDSQVATECLSSCSHPVLWCLTVKQWSQFTASVKHLESLEGEGAASPPYALCHSSLRRPPSRTLLPHNKYDSCPWQCCSTLQHSTTHCNTLQHTASHCTTLHHTASQDVAVTLRTNLTSGLEARSRAVWPLSSLKLTSALWWRSSSTMPLWLCFEASHKALPCHMTHSYCVSRPHTKPCPVTWLIHTVFRGLTQGLALSHDSFILCFEASHKALPCHMTHSYVWHDKDLMHICDAYMPQAWDKTQEKHQPLIHAQQHAWVKSLLRLAALFARRHTRPFPAPAYTPRQRNMVELNRYRQAHMKRCTYSPIYTHTHAHARSHTRVVQIDVCMCINPERYEYIHTYINIGTFPHMTCNMLHMHFHVYIQDVMHRQLQHAYSTCQIWKHV